MCSGVPRRIAQCRVVVSADEHVLVGGMRRQGLPRLIVNAHLRADGHVRPDHVEPGAVLQSEQLQAHHAGVQQGGRAGAQYLPGVPYYENPPVMAPGGGVEPARRAVRL